MGLGGVKIEVPLSVVGLRKELYCTKVILSQSKDDFLMDSCRKHPELVEGCVVVRPHSV